MSGITKKELLGAFGERHRRVRSYIEAGFVQMEDVVETGQKGRPAHLFNRDQAYFVAALLGLERGGLNPTLLAHFALFLRQGLHDNREFQRLWKAAVTDAKQVFLWVAPSQSDDDTVRLGLVDNDLIGTVLKVPEAIVVNLNATFQRVKLPPVTPKPRMN